MGPATKAQEFRATTVQRWDEGPSRLLWFSTDPTRSPQVCLLLTSSDAPDWGRWALELELNDQENFRTGKEVVAFEATRTMLRILLRRGHGVHPGFVDSLQAKRVLEIKVRFALSDDDFSYLSALLAAARADGCDVRCRLGRKPKGQSTPAVMVAPR